MVEFIHNIYQQFGLIELINIVNKLNHKRILSSWTTYTSQDDTRSIQYQIRHFVTNHEMADHLYIQIYRANKCLHTDINDKYAY
jgi:hypothetical protein